MTRKYQNNVYVVAAVERGDLTTCSNVPEGCFVSQCLEGHLKAPLPLVDVIGQPITPATKLSDFESSSCFYCHKYGHTHDECDEWFEYMRMHMYLDEEGK